MSDQFQYALRNSSLKRIPKSVKRFSGKMRVEINHESADRGQSNRKALQALRCKSRIRLFSKRQEKRSCSIFFTCRSLLGWNFITNRPMDSAITVISRHAPYLPIKELRCEVPSGRGLRKCSGQRNYRA